jgi:peptidoglycan/LPS O-acetylase OafA/YrhL
MKHRITGFEIGPPRHGQESLSLIQILRGLAALAVALDHLAFELARQFKWQAAPSLFSVGGAGVDVFFVISGFVIVYVSEPLFGKSWAPTYFVARRLARIVPLYWSTTAIVLLDDLMRHGDLAAANLSPASVAAAFYFFPYPRPGGQLAPIFSVGWTLNYELFFYSLFSVAILAARGKAVLAVVVLFVFLVTIGRLTPLPTALAFWSDPIILEFAFGMLLAAAFRAGWRCPTWLSCALIAAGIGAYLLTLQSDAMGLPRAVYWGLPAFCILAGVVFIERPTGNHRIANAFCLLGNASYALYLVHPFVFVFPRRLLPDVATTVSSPALYGLLLLGCSIAVAILVHLTFEKPATQILHGGVSHALNAVRTKLLLTRRGSVAATGSGDE